MTGGMTGGGGGGGGGGGRGGGGSGAQPGGHGDGGSCGVGDGGGGAHSHTPTTELGGTALARMPSWRVIGELRDGSSCSPSPPTRSRTSATSVPSCVGSATASRESACIDCACKSTIEACRASSLDASMEGCSSSAASVRKGEPSYPETIAMPPEPTSTKGVVLQAAEGTNRREPPAPLFRAGTRTSASAPEEPPQASSRAMPITSSADCTSALSPSASSLSTA